MPQAIHSLDQRIISKNSIQNMLKVKANPDPYLITEQIWIPI